MGYSRASRNEIYTKMDKPDLVAATPRSAYSRATGSMKQIAGLALDMGRAFVRNSTGQDAKEILGKK